MKTLANIKACVFALSTVAAVGACHHNNTQPDTTAPIQPQAAPSTYQQSTNGQNGTMGNGTPSSNDMTNNPQTSPDRVPSATPQPPQSNPMPSTDPNTPSPAPSHPTPVPPSSTP